MITRYLRNTIGKLRYTFMEKCDNFVNKMWNKNWLYPHMYVTIYLIISYYEVLYSQSVCAFVRLVYVVKVQNILFLYSALRRSLSYKCAAILAYTIGRYDDIEYTIGSNIWYNHTIYTFLHILLLLSGVFPNWIIT